MASNEEESTTIDLDLDENEIDGVADDEDDDEESSPMSDIFLNDTVILPDDDPPHLRPQITQALPEVSRSMIGVGVLIQQEGNPSAFSFQRVLMWFES